jgi:hypothetical protein
MTRADHCNSAGTLVRNAGATGAVHLGTGTYEVDFNKDKTGCAYIATAGDTGAGAVSGPIEMTVASRAGNANGVYLEAYDQSTGSLVDAPFHLVTVCPTKGRFAVVMSAGALARGSHATRPRTSRRARTR